eukprot:6202016-Pleurochrysis_carterae.AAC.2
MFSEEAADLDGSTDLPIDHTHTNALTDELQVSLHSDDGLGVDALLALSLETSEVEARAKQNRLAQQLGHDSYGQFGKHRGGCE